MFLKVEQGRRPFQPSHLNHQSGMSKPACSRSLEYLSNRPLYPHDNRLCDIKLLSSFQGIRDYHKRYYRPENLVILIDGEIDKEQLFESLRGVEEEEEAKSREIFEVPFQRPCPPFDGTVDKEVELPEGKPQCVSYVSLSQ